MRDWLIAGLIVVGSIFLPTLIGSALDRPFGSVSKHPPKYPWWDRNRCWGCEKGCTYRQFNTGVSTAQAVHEAARARRVWESGTDSDYIGGADLTRHIPRANLPHADKINPIEVAKRVGNAKRRAWDEHASRCGQSVHEARAVGTDPWKSYEGSADFNPEDYASGPESW